MAARNSIIFALDQSDVPLCLYFHDGGEEVAVAAQVGVRAAASRWDDEAYCTRIIVQNALNHLLDPAKPTGGGISLVSPEDQDAEYLPVFVCPPMMTVTIGGSQWTFDEYVALEPAMLRSVTMR
jgi:hypothetical protein